MVYLATSQVLDSEIRAKVDLHKARRSGRWRLIENPLEPGQSLSGLPPDAVCLLDCATMWLTNHLMAETDLNEAQSRLLSAIEACPATLVIVSNEVGMGIVPENALARRFREAQGRLNAALAARADLAVLVAAGLPLALKGSLP